LIVCYYVGVGTGAEHRGLLPAHPANFQPKEEIPFRPSGFGAKQVQFNTKAQHGLSDKVPFPGALIHASILDNDQERGGGLVPSSEIVLHL